MPNRWNDDAWKDYVDWQVTDAKIAQRINALIKDIHRNGPSKGIGKPEKLKHRHGWSRRITDEHRLIYDIDDRSDVYIIACKGHYE
ncbi:MAG: Txe/YoeB family addiction module toxin [Selenomonadaceae bacterium]|nr:Txe/YoeB family addiction module toxin [Selenomonadaceae bacterium]